MPRSQELLAPLLEINALIDSHRDSSDVLRESVTIVQRLLASDVSSIYLIDPDADRLVLEASRGLAPESIGKSFLPVGRGLVGRCFADLKPVISSDVFKEKDFEYLPETKEEKYHSLLAVPVLYQHRPLGVLTIQHADSRHYKPHHVHFLQLIASQLAPLINRARFQDRLDKSRHISESAPSSLQNELYKGKAASPGIAWGAVFLPNLIDEQGSSLTFPEDQDAQVDLFEKALRSLIEEIKAAKEQARVHLNVSELAIFDAYDMILAQDNLQAQVTDKIRAGETCVQAIKSVIGEISEPLLESEDVYLRERAFDIQDLGRHLIVRLGQGVGNHDPLHRPAVPHILVSQSLPIFDLVRLCTEKTVGIICEEGGSTGHTAILAQSLGIPAVIGFKGLVRRLTPQDQILLDGSTGVVIVNPDVSTQKLYKEKKKSVKSILQEIRGEQIKERIVDPYPLEIAANVGAIAQIELIHAVGADAIGLYRTEFPFLIRRHMLSEDEQLLLYKQVLEAAKGLEVTFRILDVGGDKPLAGLMLHPEENPALGWRGLRLALARPEIFELQLRALLRASAFGKMRLLFPMVASLDDVASIREHFERAKNELKKRGEAMAAEIPVGIMIEVPSAVALAEELIREVDFFSIGTNDLIQYILAVDRNNPNVSEFYDPFHPAILRAIAHVAMTAHRAHKRVSICGEMASDPRFLPFFLANHIDSLSMNPTHIPSLKRRLLEHKKKIISNDVLLKAKNSREVKELLEQT